MTKTIYLIAGLIIVVIIITIIIIFSSKKTENPAQQQAITTPTSVPVPTDINSVPLQITNTDPVDKKTATPTNQIITITFNKNLPKDVVFSIQPPAQQAANIVNNQLLINFLSTLSPNTTYTYTVTENGKTISHSYSFTTADAKSAATNDNAAQTNTNWSRANEPDLFIYNHVPYQTTDFSVTGASTQIPPYHFYFTVALLGANKDQSKQEFINWMLALGLTNEQIKTLDIRYQ